LVDLFRVVFVVYDGLGYFAVFFGVFLRLRLIKFILNLLRILAILLLDKSHFILI